VILGVETSCDETAAAVVTADGEILANVVASQVELHSPFGGVVPEVAARRHLELVSPVIETALREAQSTVDDVELVASTRGPGLVGALLVGLSAAKALAWGRSLPLASLFLRPDPVEPPFVCLLATGGHTMVLEVSAHDRYSVLGQTVDDAAGEAFDKGARLLGLGYPGGPELERVAREGDPTAFAFPVARVDGLDFSFSGVKTALLYAVKELRADELERRRPDLAASYQRAIIDALERRVHQAVEQTGIADTAIVGGVAANAELRRALPEAHAAPLALCTDNAAMIASAARWVEPLQPPDYLDLDAYASVA
jgi:N6-L-threonylcarbamoyladenine synthase